MTKMNKRRRQMRKLRTNIPPSLQILDVMPENLQLTVKSFLEIKNPAYSTNGEGFNCYDLNDTTGLITTWDTQIIMNSYWHDKMEEAGKAASTNNRFDVDPLFKNIVQQIET